MIKKEWPAMADGLNKITLCESTLKQGVSQEDYGKKYEDILRKGWPKDKATAQYDRWSSQNYKELNEHLLKSVHSYLPTWLPTGESRGNEYIALNPTRCDRHLGSFRINTRNGKWGDFATGDRGGDLISLYAYLNNLSQGEAYKALSKGGC